MVKAEREVAGEKKEKPSTNFPSTLESEALRALAYEFPDSDPMETDEKIRGRLKRKKLGAWDPDRIYLLRRFKNEVQNEICLGLRSAYYTHQNGHYADQRDFAQEKLSPVGADTGGRGPGEPLQEDCLSS